MLGSGRTERVRKPMTDQELKPPVLVVAFTPFAMAKSSHHLFNMARGYQGDKVAWAPRLYVLCAAIEIGMKAAMLGEDYSDANKGLMKSIGHDLDKLAERFKVVHGEGILAQENLDALSRINPYFKNKGLEYFSGEMLGQALRGFEDIPEVDAIVAVAEKVEAFLASKAYYIEA